MLDIVAAGEGYDDFVFHSLEALPRPGQELKTDAFQRSPGGGAVITAIAASRLGLSVRLISALSEEAARSARAEGISVMNVRRRGEPPAVTVALSTRHDRRFITYVGMNARLPGRILTALRTARARHLHLAFAPRGCSEWTRLVHRFRRARTTASWDFGWNPPLRRDAGFLPLVESLDYLFLNRAEALLYSGQITLRAAVRFWRRAACYVVIRLGARGSLVVGGDVGSEEIRAAARRVRPVDTTGAGDAFNAGFLVARLRGRDLQAALYDGNDVAALSIRRAGGLAGLPRRSHL